SLCLLYARSCIIVLPRCPCSTLFPYTTLFRSIGRNVEIDIGVHQRGRWLLVHQVADAELQLGVERVITVAQLDVMVDDRRNIGRSEEHTSELQSRENLVCRLLLEKKNYTLKRS